MPITTIFPPDRPRLSSNLSIFLAGTIDMGNSVDWQTEFTKGLELSGYDLTVLNPRRPEWDSSWAQDISNESFRGQVEWELDYIDEADFVVMNFLPDSQSPITLMELGYIAGKNDSWTEALVCCPPGFWRRGNVQIICARHKIALFDDMLSLHVALAERIEEHYEGASEI